MRVSGGVDSGTVTIVNSIIRDNTAAYYGGGMTVTSSSSATVNVYGTTFSSNTARYGPDIKNNDETVTVYGCEAGWYGGTQGSALSTYGTIGGTPYSFSGCTACAR